jgi:anti-anti-sigma factor
MSYAPTRPTNQPCRTAIPGPRLPACDAPDQKWAVHRTIPVHENEDGEPFAIHVSQRRDYTLVHISGALDMATMDETRAVLHTVLAAVGPRIVVDLGDVTFFDACGISPLVSAVHRALEHGGWVRLARVGSYQLSVLGIARLTDLLPAYGSVSAAACADGVPVSAVWQAA